MHYSSIWSSCTLNWSGCKALNLQGKTTRAYTIRMGNTQPTSGRGRDEPYVERDIGSGGCKSELRPAKFTETELASDDEEIEEFNRKSHFLNRAPTLCNSYSYHNFRPSEVSTMPELDLGETMTYVRPVSQAIDYCLYGRPKSVVVNPLKLIYGQ